MCQVNPQCLFMIQQERHRHQLQSQARQLHHAFMSLRLRAASICDARENTSDQLKDRFPRSRPKVRQQPINPAPKCTRLSNKHLKKHSVEACDGTESHNAILSQSVLQRQFSGCSANQTLFHCSFFQRFCVPASSFFFFQGKEDVTRRNLIKSAMTTHMQAWSANVQIYRHHSINASFISCSSADPTISLHVVVLREDESENELTRLPC